MGAAGTNVVVQPAAGKRLQVAVVTETFPPEINGVALTVSRLVQAVVRRGHTVQLVRPRQGPGDRARQEDGLWTLPIAGLPLPGYAGLRFGLPAGRRLLARWRERRPDVAYVATEGPLGWSAVGACAQLGIPALGGYHTRFEQYAHYYRLGFLADAVALYLRHPHNRTAATLAPTASLVRELEQSRYRKPQLLSRRASSRRCCWSMRDENRLLTPVAAEHGLLTRRRNSASCKVFVRRLRAGATAAAWQAAGAPTPGWRSGIPRCARFG